MARRRRAGFPHSDIRGSQGICPSPRLFAACHVLLRHPEPRHPPCALLCFPFSFIATCELIFLPRRGFPCGSPRRALGSVFGFQHVNVLLVENNGFEPLTPCLQSRCSSQLSYRTVQRPLQGAYVIRQVRRGKIQGRRAGPPPVVQVTASNGHGAIRAAPERRCSSRTFRYGYLVTT